VLFDERAEASMSSSSDEEDNRYDYVIGRSDDRQWADELIPFIRKKYHASVPRQKLEVLTRVQGVRKGEIREWETKAHDDLVPYRDADGVTQFRSWDNATPEQIIVGIGLHFRSKVQEENAEERFFKTFKKRRKEDVATLNPRFEKEVSRIRGLDRDHLRVRTFYCKLWKDTSSTYSMTTELLKLLSGRGDTLNRLYRRAEDCEITKARMGDRSSDSSDEEKPRKSSRKKKTSKRSAAAVGDGSDSGDMVAAAAEPDLLLQLVDMTAQLKALTEKVGGLTDMVQEQSEEIRSMKKAVKASKLEAQEGAQQQQPVPDPAPSLPAAYSPIRPVWRGGSSTSWSKGGKGSKGSKGGQGGQSVGSPSYTGCRTCGSQAHYAYQCSKKPKPDVIKEAVAAAAGDPWYEDTYEQFPEPAEWVAAAYDSANQYSTQLQQTHERTKSELKGVQKQHKKLKKKMGVDDGNGKPSTALQHPDPAATQKISTALPHPNPAVTQTTTTALTAEAAAAGEQQPLISSAATAAAALPLPSGHQGISSSYSPDSSYANFYDSSYDSAHGCASFSA